MKNAQHWLVCLLIGAALSACQPPAIEDAATEAADRVTANSEWTPVIQEFDGVQMAQVPAGCFMMGSEDGETDERPVHEVCFDQPFWIDVYEVTNAQFGSAAGGTCSAFYSSEDDQPHICINWADALAHCQSRGARLPTEAEWEYSARGPDGLAYPWGNGFVLDNAVHDGTGTDKPAPVGSKPGGVSWIGAHDLSGNVWEWVADWSEEYPSEPQVNPQGPASGEYRGVRGGAWNLNAEGVRAAVRHVYDPLTDDHVLGFRCARDGAAGE